MLYANSFSIKLILSITTIKYFTVPTSLIKTVFSKIIYIANNVFIFLDNETSMYFDALIKVNETKVVEFDF